MGILFRIALQNLLQARRRNALLSLAIGMVTMMLVLLLAMSQGIEDNLVRSATAVSAGHVVVGGFFKPTPGSVRTVITHAGDVRKVIEENTPGLAYVVERHRGWGKVIGDGGSTQAGLAGVEIAEEGHLVESLQMIEGDAQGLVKPHTVLIFETQARRLGVKVGDPVTLSTETFGGQTNTLDSTVVGIATDLGMLSSWTVFVPRADILELYQLSADTTGAIWVYLDDIDQADAVMKHLREVFAEKGYPLLEHQPVPFFMKFETVTGEDWTGQKLDVTTWKDEVSFLTWVLTAFDTLSWFLVTILVVIIAVGIMNTMWNAVRERTKEIGTMRAIGMTRRRVLILILLEAFLLGLASTSAGAALGTLVAVAVDTARFTVPIEAMKVILLSDTLRLSVRPSGVASAVTLLSILTAAAALWPAARAARMRPITAIQHVE